MITPLETSLLASLITVVANRLLSLAENTVLQSLAEVNEKLRLLQQRAQVVQCKLNRLARIHVRITAYGGWIQELAELCYEVDDLIDDVTQAEMMRHAKKSNSSVLGRLSHARTVLLSTVLSNREQPRKMNELLQKLDDLEMKLDHHARQNNNYNDYENDNGNNSDEEFAPLAVPSALQLPTGRKTDKDIIVEKLLGGTARGVSIVGMAGLGKSVLARSVVDDEGVKNHFHFIKWVSAIQGLNNCEPPVILHRPLAGGFFIIRTRGCTKTLWVLDGLEEPNQNFFERAQPDDAFLITSRDPRVAVYTRTAPYYLKRMLDEDCEELIRSAVDPAQLIDNEIQVFNNRVRHIAEKCMGLPLVAAWLGHVLNDQCSPGRANDAIRRIEITDLWELHGAQIFSALRLNDRRLARHLNKLVYFTLFPHHHSFRRDGLLQLWMAEGFIQPEEWANVETTQRHFDDMLPISMIEPSSNQLWEQSPSTYQTSEITHRLAQSIAPNLCFRGDTLEQCSFLNINNHAPRHLSICCQILQPNHPNPLERIRQHFKQLRTFLLLHRDGTGISQVHSLFNLFSLRVLDLSHPCIDRVPDSISNLKHLRYLNLSYTKINVLPESICQLFWLMILKLIQCSNLRHLPKKIGNLVNLIRLELSETPLNSTPPRIGKLKKLQNLLEYCVERNNGNRITELKDLNFLRGSIKIKQLENVKDGNEAAEAALHMKQYLRTLSIEWGEWSMPESEAAQDILTQLHPHTNLSELRVTNYSGRGFPSWLTSPYCHLQSIYLHNCQFSTYFRSFWALPYLKTLRIEKASQLRNIDRSFFGDIKCEDRFMSLERLEFCDMPELRCFRELEHGDLRYLKVLKFVNCPILTELPTVHHLASLTQFEILRCCPTLGRQRCLPPSLEEYIYEGQLIVLHP